MIHMAFDFLKMQSFVDSKKIGVMGICGLSGMALTHRENEDGNGQIALDIRRSCTVSRTCNAGFLQFSLDKLYRVRYNYLG